MLDHLFEQNREWAKRLHAENPFFFERLASLQNPEYLWIGCSDSRVPANQITGLLPGEIFVHRNLANVVAHSDLNGLSVIQFAVDILKVKHIIVCGHYGCGGVHAALHNTKLGLSDIWLQHVQEVAWDYKDLFKDLSDSKKWDLLCKLNVIAQVSNLARTTLIREAWDRGQDLKIHGWIYGLKDGLLYDLKMTLNSYTSLPLTLDQAVQACFCIQGGA
jgi:carbonic anhydrase